VVPLGFGQLDRFGWKCRRAIIRSRLAASACSTDAVIGPNIIIGRALIHLALAKRLVVPARREVPRVFLLISRARFDTLVI
jgi:hypothetical protein